MSGAKLARAVLVAIAGFWHMTVLAAQELEVASIKPSGPKSIRDFGGGPGSKDPGLYHANLASLRDLIAHAWKVDYFQISSSAPLDRQDFDLVAKVPPGVTKEEFRKMLQTLLAERFKLKIHMESKSFPGYKLAVAKTGFKPNRADSNAATKVGWPELPGNGPAMATSNTVTGHSWLVRLRAREEPLSELAKMLQTPNDPPVVDQTGLTGKYTFTLEYTKELPGAGDVTEAPPVAPDLSTALQQQLGLQLVAKKLLFDVVVVESFNKLPTEN